MIIIFSQNHDILVECISVNYIRITDDKYKIVGVDTNNKCYDLGFFSNEEQCKKILEYIKNKINSIHMSNLNIAYVYEIPKTC